MISAVATEGKLRSLEQYLISVFTMGLGILKQFLLWHGRKIKPFLFQTFLPGTMKKREKLRDETKEIHCCHYKWKLGYERNT
jgi:hypothetical protein